MPTNTAMNAQIIESNGRKQFAVIPYRQYLKMQEELEDLRDIRAIREARSDPKNQKGRPFLEAAKEHGWVK